MPRRGQAPLSHGMPRQPHPAFNREKGLAKLGYKLSKRIAILAVSLFREQPFDPGLFGDKGKRVLRGIDAIESKYFAKSSSRASWSVVGFRLCGGASSRSEFWVWRRHKGSLADGPATSSVAPRHVGTLACRTPPSSSGAEKSGAPDGDRRASTSTAAIAEDASPTLFSHFPRGPNREPASPMHPKPEDKPFRISPFICLTYPPPLGADTSSSPPSSPSNHPTSKSWRRQGPYRSSRAGSRSLNGDELPFASRAHYDDRSYTPFTQQAPADFPCPPTRQPTPSSFGQPSGATPLTIYFKIPAAAAPTTFG